MWISLTQFSSELFVSRDSRFLLLSSADRARGRLRVSVLVGEDCVEFE